MIGATVRGTRRFCTVFGGTLALVAMAWPAAGCRRKDSVPARSPTANPARSTRDAKPLVDPTFLVLVWTETTPPGARIVRVSDGYSWGLTPDIVELHQSTQPVAIRFELEGYVPVTREVPALTDGELKIVLDPIPKAAPPASRQSKASKAHGRPR